jgi:PAS domain-containing protein
MGGTVSVSGNSTDSISSLAFLSADVIEGCKKLSSDEALSRSFVEYVKSGAWLDLIAHYVSEDTVELSDTFSLAERRLSLSSASNASEKSALVGSSKKSGNDASSKSAISPLLMFLGEAYTGWTESLPVFSTSQLSSLLFAVVFPCYLRSSTYHRHVKYGALAARYAEEESSMYSNSVVAGADMFQAPQSSRAQEMLLACAACIDEIPMIELVRTDWAKTVSTFLSTHACGISMLDTSKIGFPFLYVNRRFESLFGYEPGAIIGKPLRILSGEGTEPDKKAQLLIALKSQVCRKFCITRYTSAGRAVQDGVAVLAVGGHAICVHFFACPGAETVPVTVRAVDCSL